MNLIEESFQNREEQKKKENNDNHLSCYYFGGNDNHSHCFVFDVYKKYGYEINIRWTSQ